MRVPARSQVRPRKLRAIEPPTWLQLAAALAPFALLLIAGLVNPQFGPGLHFGAVRTTIWATVTLLLPALMLAPYSASSRVIANLSELYWTFGLIMFLIHLYFGVFTIFGGLADTLERVGAWSFGFNCFLIGWWCCDVVVTWLVGHSGHRIRLAHAAAQVFVFLVFAAGLVFHDGPVQKLGLLFVVGVLLSLAIRLVLPDRPIQASSKRFTRPMDRRTEDAGFNRRPVNEIAPLAAKLAPDPAADIVPRQTRAGQPRWQDRYSW